MYDARAAYSRDARNEAHLARTFHGRTRHGKIDLADGRILGVPQDFFPLLKAATDEERNNYQLHGLTIRGLLGRSKHRRWHGFDSS